jgi:hypothetical protein
VSGVGKLFKIKARVRKVIVEMRHHAPNEKFGIVAVPSDREAILPYARFLYAGQRADSARRPEMSRCEQCRSARFSQHVCLHDGTVQG